MNRWARSGVLALVFFVINVVGRLVSRLSHATSDSAQFRIGLIGMIVIGLAAAGAAVWWALRYPFSRVFFDLGAAILVADLLALLVGPFVSGDTSPFHSGAGYFIAQFFYFILFAGVGGFLGFFGTVAFGKDWKSRGLRRYEEVHAPRRSRA